MFEVLDRVTMQVFVRDHFSMIAAAVQGDVDGIAKGSHLGRVAHDDDNWCCIEKGDAMSRGARRAGMGLCFPTQAELGWGTPYLWET